MTGIADINQYLSFCEIDDHISKSHDRGSRSIAIIPVGCTEQHGPFLPIETDTIIAKNIALAVSKNINEKYWSYVFPAINYTPTKSNLHFSGTISVDEELFRNTVKQSCQCILNSKFDGIALLSGHAPADPSVREVCFNLVHDQYESRKEQIKPVFVISLFESRPVIEEALQQKSGKHADWTELLYLYHILGSRYFNDKKINEIIEFKKRNRFELLNSPILGIPVELRSVKGVIGEPIPASVENWKTLGEIVWEKTVSYLTRSFKQNLKEYYKKDVLKCN